MKKKTVLSILTLFFLLQAKPTYADNFFWNILTSPVSPYALLIGFWSFVKVVGVWIPNYEKFENLKNANVADTQDRAENNLDIAIQRFEFLSKEIGEIHQQTKEEQHLTMNVMHDTDADCSEQIQVAQLNREETNKELENNFCSIAERIMKRNHESNNEIRKHCDNGYQRIIDITDLRLLAEQKKLSKHRKETKKMHEKATVMLESFNGDITKEHAETNETIGILKLQVNNIGLAHNTSIRINQLELEKLEEKKNLIKKAKQTLEEYKIIFDRVKAKKTVKIAYPKIKESTKQLFYKTEKLIPKNAQPVAQSFNLLG